MLHFSINGGFMKLFFDENVKVCILFKICDRMVLKTGTNHPSIVFKRVSCSKVSLRELELN